MRDIRTGLTDIPVHLAHHTNMLVAVQQRVLLIPTRTSTPAMGSPVGLQAGIGQDDNQALGVLVMGVNGDMLLRDQLGQLGRRARLSP